MAFGLSSVYYDVIFFLCCHRLIKTLDLSSAYYDVMFFIILLRYFIFVGVIHSYKQSGFDQSNISNYGYQYAEELKS